MKDHHAPARAFVEAGVPVAIGTDFNPGTSPAPNLALAMSFAVVNLGLSPDEALAAVTINAARALSLEDEIGSLEPGKLADIALWRVDGLAHAGCEDPVAALVLGSRPPLARLLVGGRTVVEDDVLLTTDEHALARRATTATRTLLARSGR
jgi:cytosine/adenosine deaminase-related metal-dependent hydrolase